MLHSLQYLLPSFFLNKALGIPGDLTIQSDVENLINTTLEHFKQLDILVGKAFLYSP